MKKTVENIDVAGKKVLLRVDFNVPLDEEGNITDTKRITEALPTIKYLLAKGAKVIAISHLGRPEGVVNPKYSMLPVAKALITMLACKVRFASDIVGKDAQAKIAELKNGELLLLENVRFHKEEELNDPDFAKKLSKLADIYVNDAFGTAHRKHSSTYGVAKLMPACLGLLMGKESNIIEQALTSTDKPFVAVLGGAKIADKIQVIRNLLPRVDTLIIGGAMAYTFIASQGGKVGSSLVDNGSIEFAKEMLAKAKSMGVEIVLPVDSWTATEFKPDAPAKRRNSNDIPDGEIAMDIGPKAAKQFAGIIKRAKIVIWNGPMGVFEFMNFGDGTKKVAKAMTKVKGLSIVGGGDSSAAVHMLNLEKKYTQVSTGGGATLKLLEGLQLPCIEIIEDVKE